MLEQWSSWSSCSKSCNEGFRSRSRDIVQQADGGGLLCEDRHDYQHCNLDPCPGAKIVQKRDFGFSISVDCKLTEWTSWSSCTKTCSGGTRTREKRVLRSAQYGGQTCPKLQETNECNTIECPGKFNFQLSIIDVVCFVADGGEGGFLS